MGRTERPTQPKQLLDTARIVKSFLQTWNVRGKSHRDVALLHTGSSVNSSNQRNPLSLLHLKCSCPLTLPELQLQTFKQSGTTVLWKGLQCQADCHGRVFSVQT